MTDDRQVRGMGLFSDSEPLEQAIHQIKSISFDLSHVSVIARGIEKTAEAEDVQVSQQIGDQTVASSTGIVTDAVRTATWGSLLVGLTGLAIPGLGAVIAAGSVGVALLTGLAGTGLSLANFNNLVSTAWPNHGNVWLPNWLDAINSGTNSLFLTIGPGDFLVHHYTIPHKMKPVSPIFTGEYLRAENRQNVPQMVTEALGGAISPALLTQDTRDAQLERTDPALKEELDLAGEQKSEGIWDVGA